MEETAQLRVALVGGAPLLQAGTAAVLAHDRRFAVVLRAPDVPSAIDSLGQQPCDVVVLNAEEPPTEVAALRGAMTAHPAQHPPRILVLTDDDRLETVLAALRAGAQGYGVRHRLWPEDIHAGVLAVGRGLPWACPDVTRSLIALAARAADAASWDGGSGGDATQGTQAAEPHRRAPGDLSLREAEILRLAARGANDGGIAAALYLSPNSVKTYWQRIRVKLGAASRREAIRHAVTQGLVPDRRLTPRTP